MTRMPLAMPFSVPFAKTVARTLAVATVAAAGVIAPVAASAPADAASSARYGVYHTTLPNGRTVVVRWNGCQRITYKVNLAAVPRRARPAVLRETKASVHSLAYRTGFRFTYRGTTREVPQRGSVDRQSAELVIAYTTPKRTNIDLSGTTMGQGGFSYRWWGVRSGSKVVYRAAATRGYVVIDSPDMLRRTRPGAGPGTHRRNLMEHELGHAFGLKHVRTTKALMNPVISSRTPNGYHYAGEIAGLKRVGRPAGCINMAGSGVRDLK